MKGNCKLVTPPSPRFLKVVIRGGLGWLQAV